MIRIKRADRLIAANVLSTLVIVWLVLVGFDALTQFLRQLGHVGKHGYTLVDAALYIAYTVPRRMYQYFNHAALIGGLLGLGGLAASGELTALRAAGMSKLRVAGSVTAVVAVLTVGVVLMGETVAPVGDQLAQALQVRMRADNLGLAGGNGLWAREGDTVVNAKSALATRGAQGTSVELVDVRLFTFTDDGQLVRFDRARKATHAAGHWLLHDVRETTLDANGTHSRKLATLPWTSKLSPRVLEQSVVHPEYLSMRDLRRSMRYARASGLNTAVYANAFWARALYPLNVLVLVLCAMPFAFGTLRSGGLGKRLFLGILLAIVWYFLQRVITNMGTVYGVPAVLANLLPAMVLAGAVTAYFRRYG